MNREKLKDIRTRTNTGGFLEQIIDAILEEPSETMGQHAKAVMSETVRLKAVLQAMTADRDRWRNSYESRRNELEDLRVELGALRDTVEARNKQVDALNQQIIRIGNERDALRARIEGGEERWIDREWKHNSTTAWLTQFARDNLICVRLVPDPLPSDAPVTTSDGKVIGSCRITTSGEVPS